MYCTMVIEHAATAPRVLVTGATGFVGRPLVRHLAAQGWPVTAAVRSLPQPKDRVREADYIAVGDIGPQTDWTTALRDVTHVVHAAARVHVMHGGDAAAFQRVNAEGTARLAQQAAASGVSRLVLLSSIKVNGEATDGRPFRADDPPAPQDAYARSKLAAEERLWRACRASGMEGVVLRLPLVLGPGARANVARLVQLVRSDVLLPLGSIDNRRSLLALGNLCDFVALSLEHPQAGNRVWLLSDGEDLSTPELLRQVAAALGCRLRLLRCPVSVLRVVATLVGRSAEIARLAGSLQVDSEPARRELGWHAPLTTREGVRAAAVPAAGAGDVAAADTARGAA